MQLWISNIVPMCIWCGEDHVLMFVPVKIKLPQENCIRSFTQPEIKRQRPFVLMVIKYYWIKDEVVRMKHVE